MFFRPTTSFDHKIYNKEVFSPSLDAHPGACERLLLTNVRSAFYTFYRNAIIVLVSIAVDMLHLNECSS